jgi:hypothetical protein
VQVWVQQVLVLAFVKVEFVLLLVLVLVRVWVEFVQHPVVFVV